MFGYTGKILRLDLTQRKSSVIDTDAYRKWGGGHGIGSALFWDLCRDKTIDGFDERNLVTCCAPKAKAEAGCCVPVTAGGAACCAPDNTPDAKPAGRKTCC